MTRRPSRRAVLAAAGLGAASLAGCTAGYRSASTVDATSSLEPRRTPATDLDEAPLTPQWETSIPGQFTLSTPGLTADRLFVGSASRMTAIAREDGAEEWHTDLGGLTHGFTPAVDEERGTLLAAARDVVGRRSIVDRGGSPSLTALDAASGEREWREGIRVSASPVVDDGTAFVPLVDDEGTAVTARAAASGAERWTTRLSTPDVFAAPAVGEGVYVATREDADGEGRLVALTRDGEVRWTESLEGEAYKGPLVAGPSAAGGDEAVFVGTDAGYVYAFEADGSRRWRASLDGAVNTTPAVADGLVYATSPRNVVAMDVETGEGVWSGAVDHVDKTGLGLGGGMVHVGGNEVAAFDADDGAARWRIELPGVAGTFGSPLWRDGTLYTGACVKIDGSSLYDHVVYALE